MKPANETVKGNIVHYDPQRKELTIKAPYEDFVTLCRREYKECWVQLIDSRPISEKQRRACYALIRAIADYTGMGVDETKTWTKIKFLVEDLDETADKLFSLANAPMSLVCAFQKFLIDLVISWEIPTKRPLIEMVDDVDSYIYACLVNKKCCVCGKPAFLHHHDRVGMGRNREEIAHVGMLAEPLCWDHHTESHTMSQEKFDRKYHIKPVKIDKTIVKIYELNEKEILEGEMNDE